jgi:hypothetical protein
MLQLCRSDITRGQAGFCTGYVLGVWNEWDVGPNNVWRLCPPRDFEYEDMLRIVVRYFEEVQPEDTRPAVKRALFKAWGCKE